MDRRKVGRTLHKNLTSFSTSQGSTESEDMFGSSSHERSQKRLSNTELLRQKLSAISPESESRLTQQSTSSNSSQVRKKAPSPVEPVIDDDSSLFSSSSASSLESSPKKRQRLRSESPESPRKMIPPSQRQIPPSQGQISRSLMSQERPGSSQTVSIEVHPIPPSQRQIPPSQRQIPPSQRQIPPSQRQIPPSQKQISRSLTSQERPGLSQTVSIEVHPIPPSQRMPISRPVASQNRPGTSHAALIEVHATPASQRRPLSTPTDVGTFCATPKPPKNLSARIKRPTKTSQVVGSKKFHSFLVESGVILDENDEQFVIENDPFHVAKKMQNLLSSGDYSKEEILAEWKENILQNKDSLEIALKSSIHRNSDRPQLGSLTSISLMQIFLHVNNLQTEILNGLLEKLNEEVIISETSQDLPWACPFIKQLRFLGIIQDPVSMTGKIEDLLETSPIWFQEYLISFIPDIVVDAQHEIIAVILCRLIEIHDKLTKVILDCLTNLSLGKEYREEIYDRMLTILQNGCHISKIPPIIAFCLDDCSTNEACLKVLRVIRELELQPMMKVNPKEYYMNQMLIVNILKMKIPRIKEMANAALHLLSTADSAKPLDIIILIVLYNGSRKKKVEALIKQHAKSGFYSKKFLILVYRSYRDVVKNLQSTALLMATTLLKSDDPMLIKFAGDWIRGQFHALDDRELCLKQQEILEKLMLIMGYNNETAKNALDILCQMTEFENERKFLQSHANYLRSLIEKIVMFDLEEVTTLNNVLHALCTDRGSGTGSDALRDDLFMMMSKQLTSMETTVKCKGVVGAVMAIKHLAVIGNNPQKALEIFQRVQSNVKGYPRSQGLFYDKLGDVIPLTEDIDEEFLTNVRDTLNDEFVNVYACANNEYDQDLQPIYNLNLTESENSDFIITFTKCKSGVVLASLLRLFKVCLEYSDRGLHDISDLLGSAILMPTDMETADAETLDLMFYCINWCRELINTFVTDPNAEFQKKVSKRLDNVMELQGRLSTLLMYAEPRYQPPPCYFHRMTAPPLNKVEKKPGRKGKRSAADKTISIPEWESWENGMLLSTKNPMYFRRLDARILHFLDVETGESDSEDDDTSSIGQVCFIIKEILGVFESDLADVTFVGDLIDLLPKIFAKLQLLVDELRTNVNNQNKHAVRLMLHLLQEIFSWKNLEQSGLLQKGLKTVAGQLTQSNSALGTFRELVAESYKFFESMIGIATDLPTASSLVELCRTFMELSTTFSQEHRAKQATMAYNFLASSWPDDRHVGAAYRAAIVSLLKNWMDHEPNPLHTVSIVMNWLPEEVANLEEAQDALEQFPTINRSNIHHLISKIFSGMNRGIKISLSTAAPHHRKFQVWVNVARNTEGIMRICQILRTRNLLLIYLRMMPLLLRIFLTSGMPILEHNLRYQRDDVIGVLKHIQHTTRYLNAVCVESSERKDMALTKLIPAAKAILEKLVYSVKSMLTVNNCSTAFWMGNLVNKNLDGREIYSQNSTVTDDSSLRDVNGSVDNNEIDDEISEAYESDLDEADGNSLIDDE